MDRRARLQEARLYFICDHLPGGRPLADVLPRALAGGVDVFQLRIKGGDDELVLRAAATAREACVAAGALFVLNDRPELVAVAGADGVHVGQEDLPVAEARRLVGPDRIVGVSTHTPAQLDTAAGDGADYAGVGPVAVTPTKPGRPAAGLDYVRHAAGHAEIPFFAIGGIDRENIGDVLSAGTSRVAVVRAIAEADDPLSAARELRDQLDARLATSAGDRLRVGDGGV